MTSSRSTFAWLSFAAIAAAAGCTSPNTGLATGYLASDKCIAAKTSNDCNGVTGCTWVYPEDCTNCDPAPPGVGSCVSADRCLALDSDACAADTDCAWSAVKSLCPQGANCASGGFCHTRDNEGGACACVSPQACPADGDCPKIECDCSGGGGGGTGGACTCACPDCAPGADCAPCVCNCGGGSPGCNDVGTCACACPSCPPGEVCPPCDCGCGSGEGTTVNGGGPKSNDDSAGCACECPACPPNADCEPCECNCPMMTSPTDGGSPSTGCVPPPLPPDTDGPNQPKPCPTIACFADCPNGFKMDPTSGCSTCDCL